jgi:hypothetical protein
MHPAHTADTRANLIFIHNGAPQALAGCCLMHPAHTADTRANLIFIHNGAPQALVGCYENASQPLSSGGLTVGLEGFEGDAIAEALEAAFEDRGDCRRVYAARGRGRLPR